MAKRRQNEEQAASLSLCLLYSHDVLSNTRINSCCHITLHYISNWLELMIKGSLLWFIDCWVTMSLFLFVYPWNSPYKLFSLFFCVFRALCVCVCVCVHNHEWWLFVCECESVYLDEWLTGLCSMPQTLDSDDEKQSYIFF